MMNNNRFDELLDDWARERLGAEERAEFEAIIAADAELRAEARDHRHLMAAIASEKPARAPAGLVAAAMARARAEAASAKVVEVAPVARIEEIRPAGNRMLWFAAAAALVAIAGGTAVLWPEDKVTGRLEVAEHSPQEKQIQEMLEDGKLFFAGPDASGDMVVAQSAETVGGAALAAEATVGGEQKNLEDAVAALGMESAIAAAEGEELPEAAMLADAAASIAEPEAAEARRAFGENEGGDMVIASVPAGSADAFAASEREVLPEAPAAWTIKEEKEEMVLALAAPTPTPLPAREVERPLVERRTVAAERSQAAVPNRAERPANEAGHRAVDEPRPKVEVRDITPPAADAAPEFALAMARTASPEPQMSAVQAVPLEPKVADFFEKQTRRVGGSVVAFADPKVFAADFPNQQALDSFLRMLEVVPVEVDRSDVPSSQPATVTPASARGIAASPQGSKAAPRYSFTDGGRMFGIDRAPRTAAAPAGEAKDTKRSTDAARPKTTMLDLDQYVVETVRSGESGRVMLLIRRRDASAETHRMPARVQSE